MLKRLTTPSIFLILLLGLCVSMVGVDEALANLIEKPNESDTLVVTERKNTSVKLNWSGGPGFWMANYWFPRQLPKEGYNNVDSGTHQ